MASGIKKMFMATTAGTFPPIVDSSDWFGLAPGGHVAFSSDGAVWYGYDNESGGTVLPDTGNNWYRQAYKDGRIVAVGNAGQIAYSDDGLHYTSLGAIGTSQYFRVAANATKYIAVGLGGRISQSTNGTTWTTTTLPGVGALVGILWGTHGSAPNGTWVLSDNGGQVWHSVDNGATWTLATTLPASSAYNDVAFMPTGTNTGIFILAGTNEGNLPYSVDGGVTWIDNYVYSGDWSSVTYGNGFCMAISTNSGLWAYSLDGINWSRTGYFPASVYSPPTLQYFSACASNDLHVYGGQAYAGNGVAIYSRNGATFYKSAQPTNPDTGQPTTMGQLYGVTSGVILREAKSPPTITRQSNGAFALAYDGNAGVGGPGYDAWNPTTAPSGQWLKAASNRQLRAVAAGLGQVLRVDGFNGSIATGVTYTTHPLAAGVQYNVVAHGHRGFIVGGVSSVAYGSIDGANWFTSPLDDDVSGVWGAGWGNGYYILSANQTAGGSLIFRSPDLKNWVRVSAPSTVTGIAYYNGVFVGCGPGGALIYSTDDGLTWTNYSTGDDGIGFFTWMDIAATPHGFMGVSNGGKYCISATGTGTGQWAVGDMPAGSIYWSSIASAEYVPGSNVVAVGGAGSIAYYVDPLGWYYIQPLGATITYNTVVSTNIEV